MSQCNEDILGAYFCDPDHAPSVEVYWMPVALLAAVLGIQIEDLTVVVLTHELAHAYTHLGKDIDGHGWQDDGFQRSDPRIVEGLAQFYTEIVTRRLSERVPGAHDAYTSLLHIQGPVYTAHQEWGHDDGSQRAEIVRFVMLAARNSGQVTYDGWLALLDEATETLGRTNRPTSERY